MDGSPRLRRSRSLKNVLSSRARRDSVLDHEDALPPLKPSKPTLIQLHITADDIGLTPAASRPPSSSLAVPSPRNTWPQGLRESRPGTYAFSQPPTLVKTPWEQNRTLRSAPRRSKSSTRGASASQTFARLPREMLHCVLEHLRDSYTEDARLDVLGHRSDLRKLCVTNKQWHRVAREHLYREIWLPSASAPRSVRSNRRRLSLRANSRLNMLLRTLQESPGLAQLVKRLWIPPSMAADFDVEIYMDASRGQAATASLVLPTVCEIVRRCSNLQALSGHHVLACDRATELLHALESCIELREHVWSLPRCASDWEPLVRPGAFVNHHAQWRRLETLVIREDATRSDCLGPGIVTAVLQRLPSLKHLMLQGLSRSEFHNGTLLMLPALKALRLEDMPGISDHGLQQLVHSRLAMSLEKFSLIGLELTSLRTVQTLMANLPRLRRFSLIQETSPELQEVFSFTASAFSLGSQSLEHLHWNTLLAGNATAILANAMAADKFPRLRSVMVPCDYDGAVQKLCQPIRQRPLTGRELTEHMDSVRTAGLEYRRTVQFHDIEAQLRAKRAKKDSVFSVTVEDEEGVERYQWSGSYLGSIASKVVYCLGPVVEGQRFSHVCVEDLARPARREDGVEQNVGLDVLF